MKTFRTHRDQLVMLVIKVSTAIILCLLLMNALNGMAQSMPFKSRIQSESLQEKIRHIYNSQIGVREKPANSGPQIEKYLKYVGLTKGNPWCAAFVCWVLGEAGVKNPRSGWSPVLFGTRYVIWDREQRTKNKEQRLSANVPNLRSCVSHNVWASTRCAYPPPAGVGGGMLHHRNLNPTTGDIFGLYFSEKGRIAHVGFVDDWKDGWVTTVEGNTNIAGSREGDGVYRKRRLVRSVYKVARYINH